MNKNILILERGIFTLLIITLLGLIVVNEKGGELFSPKINEKINIYIDENYSNIKNNIKLSPIEYNNKTFKTTIKSKENDNHYFNITYSKGKITDTYITDYKEGKNLLNHIEESISKEISNKTNIKCIINMTTTLDNYSEKIQERLIDEDNLINLKVYYIEKELIIKEWNNETILKEITNFIDNMNKNNIEPKYYKIIITEEKDITNSIEINNITNDFINDKNKSIIINDILNNKELENSNITFKYLN